MTDTKRRRIAPWQLLGAFVLAAMATTYAETARAIEIIPSIGITKSTDENAGDAQGFGGLAVRIPMLSILRLEGGIGYRQDSFSGGDLTVRQWPVTASVWVVPFPMLYAGGGLGWYRTTYDFDSSLSIKDETESQTGVHLGGGLLVPVASNLSLDLQGRYVFMQANNDNVQLPTTFNPDFWTTTLGLAIRF